MSKKKSVGEPLLISKKHIDYEDLEPHQRKAVNMFSDWFKSKKTKKSEMVFRLGGCAGTGKSFLIRYLIESNKFTQNDCYVVAYTGQAVNVLRQSGILAKTIHSTFMRTKEEPLLDEDGNEIIRRGVPVTRLKFTPIPYLPSTVKLVICDEASFLDEKMEKLMLRYNVPILEVGDPVQLPPVSGKQCFYMDNLDIFMDTIMRQASDSEIVKLATSIRHYMPIDKREYGKDVKFMWAQPNMEETFFRFKPFVRGADMIITTSNRDRTEITDLYRKYIVKTDSPFPVKGERLICRRNDWNLSLGEFPLTNGTKGYARHTVGKSEIDFGSKTYTLDFQPDFISNDYFDGLLCDTEFLEKNFGSKDADYYSKLNPGKKFEYSHAITTHLAQGAQYDKVLFMDSFYGDPEYHMRIRYTAVTRAVKTLYYMLPYSKWYPGWTDLWKGGKRPNGT